MPKTMRKKPRPFSDTKCEVFCSLHHHTTFSTGDGHESPDQHFKRASELGMKAMALTEHGNLSSHVAGEIAAKKYGIKFIPGIEAYSGPAIREAKYKRKFHQTILAMNAEGYRNLNRLVTQSYRDFYQFPTVSWENLKEHNEGLIVTSGCASSLSSCKLLGGKLYGEERLEFTDRQFQSVLRVVRRYQKVFGDRYYLEVQRFPDLPRVCKINQALEKISEITGIPLLATADVHYCHEEQSHIQQALHAIHRGSNVEKIGADWEYDIPLTFPESDAEIFQNLIDSGLSRKAARQAIYNTRKVARRCNVSLPKSDPLEFPIPDAWADAWADGDWLPGWPVSPEMKAAFFDEQIEMGIEYRAMFGKDCKGPEYQKRIQHELSVMKQRPEFIDYFLFLSDLIIWAKSQGIVVGPGRGSAAASLVCYLLRITEIDPMTVPTMVFERFMDPSRTDLPDIDIDIDDEDRYKLVDYLRFTYGQENVGNVANIIKYRGKSALDKTAMIYNLPKDALKPLKERISDRVETDDRVDDSIADAIDTYRDDPAIAEILKKWEFQLTNISSAIEGDVQTYGTHAAGYIVSSKPITDTCALYERNAGDNKGRKIITIPYDKRDAEYLGMMKADLLGLITCGTIGKTIEQANQVYRNKNDALSLDHIYNLPLDDPKIFDAWRNDDLVGIFQFEGGTTRKVSDRVRPYSILELSDINALARPGPLFSGAVDRYVDCKFGRMEIDPVHELYYQHTEDTYGQIIYQEQIMKILQSLAGFDTPKVLRVRKIIGKKLGEFQFAELWEEFRDGCEKTAGLDSDTAWKIWSSITTAAGYAFNIAHSYAYSVIAYWCMYLKLYYPEAFYAASLAKNGDGKNDLPRRVELLRDLTRHGRRIETIPIDPIYSSENWRALEIKPNKAVLSTDTSRSKIVLVPGFIQVPGVGETTARALKETQGSLTRQAFDLASQTERRLPTWADLAAGTRGVGPKTLETIMKFASADDPFAIHKTERTLEAFRKELDNGDYEGVPDLSGYDTGDFLSSKEVSCIPDWELVAWVGLVANIVHRDAIEYERTKTGKTIEEIKEEMTDSDLTKHAVVFAYDEHGEVALRFGRKIYPRWESMIGQLKENHHIVVVIGNKMPGMGGSILPKQVVVLDPD